MTTRQDDSQWARPGSRPTEPQPPIDEAADLDWVRRQMVELDDLQRSMPATDIAARHAIHETIDGLRTILQAGHADQIHAVREGWEARAGRKGEHDIDPDVLVGFVKSMMSSGGGIG
jgi:hypothetical protein